MRKATVFADFYERVNYVSMILCFGRVVSCVERLDTNGFKFSAQPSVPYILVTPPQQHASSYASSNKGFAAGQPGASMSSSKQLILEIMEHK